jgi:chemotaxis protein methyltransferase CheR
MDIYASPDECKLSPASFARFARFITGELGIKMPESKLTLVQSRLLRRVRDLRLDSVEEYGEYFFASANAAERDHFINAITTNKTDFFREPEHFEYLTGTVLPAFSKAAGGRPHARMNVWSAGCSSGEEPYTLGMVLSEYGQPNPGFDFAILGTDISTKVLEQARNGIYQETQIVPIPPELRRKYLMQSRDKSRQLARIAPNCGEESAFTASISWMSSMASRTCSMSFSSATS